jgi:hypothetical protein
MLALQHSLKGSGMILILAVVLSSPGTVVEKIALLPMEIFVCFSLPVWDSNPTPGKPYCTGRISTVDLLIKTGCFVKKEKYSFSLKSS